MKQVLAYQVGMIPQLLVMLPQETVYTAKNFL